MHRHTTVVDGCACADHDATAHQSRRFRACLRMDLHRLSSSYRGHLRKGSNANGWRQRRAVLAGYLLLSMTTGKTVPWLSTPTGAACATRLSPC
jgi:hypothetical protein